MTVLLLQNEPVIGKDGRVTLTHRRWLELVTQLLNSGATEESVQALITEIATKLGSPDGTVENIPDPLPTIGNAGGGSFKLVDIDGKGRVKGYSDGTSDNVTEGTTHLYFTDARAYAAVKAALQAGTHSGVSFAFDDGAHSISVTASGGVPPETPCLQFTTDTGSTADSDPGAGLVKWNNATQSSATKLFFDDATADTGTDLSAYFAELAASSTTGIVHMVAEDGSFKLYKWTGVADGTGYFKFTVSHLVSSGGNFADNIPVRVVFYPMPPAGGGGGGSVAWTLLNSWDFSVSGAVASIEANLTGYNEVLVIVTDVTLASSGWRALQLSWNGGTTWLTSYDYLNATGTRNTAGNTFQIIHGIAASAARCGTAQFSLMASQEAPVVGTNNMGNIQFLIPAQGTKPNRIKVGGWVTGGPTNMTGGKVAIFAR